MKAEYWWWVIVAIAVVLLIAYFALYRPATAPKDGRIPTATSGGTSTMTPVPIGTTTGGPGTTTGIGAFKTFTMTASYRTDGGTSTASFSQKEIVVKKGDRVRITVTNIAGDHDFTIDEYGIKKDTPENATTVIEFTADKAGSFEYYCSKYNHREVGQKGTLVVVE